MNSITLQKFLNCEQLSDEEAEELLDVEAVPLKPFTLCEQCMKHVSHLNTYCPQGHKTQKSPSQMTLRFLFYYDCSLAYMSLPGANWKNVDRYYKIYSYYFGKYRSNRKPGGYWAKEYFDVD